MEWKISPEPVPYEEAVACMEARVAGIIAGHEQELVWLLEHPPLFTAGSSAKDSDLKDTLGFPVHKTGRGGQYTYHGPGQRIVYVMLDLRQRGKDVRAFVKHLEQWIILTLNELGVTGEVREGRIGVWVKTRNGGPEAKIAALGIRIRQWVTYHGLAINVNPDLTHYRGIVPCGIRDYGVTSLAALGIGMPMQDIDRLLKRCFADCFSARRSDSSRLC